MRFFHHCLRGFVVGLILSFALSCRAQGPITVLFRETGNEPTPVPTVTAAVEVNPLVSLGDGEGWARLDRTGVMLVAEVDSPGLVIGRAIRSPGALGIALVNVSALPVKIRVGTELGAGLWRVEAALQPSVKPVETEGESTARQWRMESVLRKSSAQTFKEVAIPAGQILLLRFTDTGAEAKNALKVTWGALEKSKNSVMRDRVAAALNQIGDMLDILPVLVERGDRTKIIGKIHTALLTSGKAQAVWQNWRESSLDQDDTAFDDLVTTLSEISCAACNLVPTQTVLPGKDGGPATLRVTVTNAGDRTVPLLALGVADHQSQGSDESSKFTAFRSLAPGDKVSADFRLSDQTVAKGVVQYVLNMGAAVVPTCPKP